MNFEGTKAVASSTSELLTTFHVGEHFFGLEVMRVQEVTGHPSVVPVPLAPAFVCGLVNLRGQIATAIALGELFGYGRDTTQQMSVVCRLDGNLVSLLVDSIGDVVEVEHSQFEPSPPALPASIKQFVKGIYKMDKQLLSVLDLEALAKELSPNQEIN